jgi:hypothetical protein
MDQDFKAFLSKKGITEDEYKGGSLGDRVKLVEIFEKSKQGKRKHHLLLSLVSFSLVHHESNFVPFHHWIAWNRCLGSILPAVFLSWDSFT